MTQTYTPADFPPGLVAIPAQDWMWTESAAAFMALSACLPPGSKMMLGRESSSPAANRNHLTEVFLSDPQLKWILFCDSDMTPEPHTALALLSRQVAMVGALYYLRHPPHRMAIGRSLGDPITFGSTGLCEVDYVGTGCLFVRRKVIAALTYPWFVHPAPGVAEDLMFSLAVRKMGCPIFVDLDLCVRHFGARAIGKEEAYMFQHSSRGKAMLEGPLAGYPMERAAIQSAVDELTGSDGDTRTDSEGVVVHPSSVE